MAYALDRQHARLVRAYARLRQLYNKSLDERARLKDDLHDARIAERRARVELRRYTDASHNTLGKLLATTQYAISHLVESGDVEAAEKLSEWLDEMRDALQPVADVRQLVDLLDEWAGAALADDDDTAALYLRTRMVLDELRGRDADER